MFRMCVCKVPLFILFLHILSSLLNVSLILMAFLREMIKDLDTDVKKGEKNTRATTDAGSVIGHWNAHVTQNILKIT